MNQILFKKLLFAMMCNLIVYLCFSFYATTFNIKLWSDGSRFLCSLGFLFFTFVVLSMPKDTLP